MYIYVHGGGYLFGDLETEDTFCRLYATGISSIVLSVEYRKTPEWRFPTSFHDVFNAVDWILDSAQATEYGIDLNKVIFGGVSSGGTMGLAAAVREVEQVSLPTFLIKFSERERILLRLVYLKNLKYNINFNRASSSI